MRRNMQTYNSSEDHTSKVEDNRVQNMFEQPVQLGKYMVSSIINAANAFVTRSTFCPNLHPELLHHYRIVEQTARIEFCDYSKSDNSDNPTHT